MVQIKKKVTLRVKSEENPEAELVQQHAVHPTLRKKESAKCTNPVQSSPERGKGSYAKVIGGIVGIAVIGLLGYGVYYLLSSSERKDNKDLVAEQVENVAASFNTEDKYQPANETGQETEISNGNDASAGVTDEKKTERKVTTGTSVTKLSQEENVSDKQMNENITVQSTTLSGTLEQKAKDVIRGIYGNGEVRKQKLGEQYTEIQNKVNEMYRNGLVN